VLDCARPSRCQILQSVNNCRNGECELQEKGQGRVIYFLFLKNAPFSFQDSRSDPATTPDSRADPAVATRLPAFSLTPQAISYAVRRGQRIAGESGYALLDKG
jgi:hypothetical protein